jgi:hypothetical protein
VLLQALQEVDAGLPVTEAPSKITSSLPRCPCPPSCVCVMCIVCCLLQAWPPRPVEPPRLGLDQLLQQMQLSSDQIWSLLFVAANEKCPSAFNLLVQYDKEHTHVFAV